MKTNQNNQYIARTLLRLWERLSALPMLHAPGTLQAQIERWFYPQVPALAYAYVPIRNYRARS